MRLIRFARLSQPTRQIPPWCIGSVMLNIAAVGTLAGLLAHTQFRPNPLASSTAAEAIEAVEATEAAATEAPPSSPEGDFAAVAQAHRPTATASEAPELGPRHRLSYEDWVALLEQEAIAAGERPADQLTVLMGDSISLWFPPELLPSDRSWLNQGISGEITSGLLKRLDLIEETEPDTILLMIGINDLIRGVREETLLANYRLIVEALQDAHPDTQIVVQSILPHAAEAATWEGADQLSALPNGDIRDLNEDIAAIAEDNDATYLDLMPLFTNGDGDLKAELTTDGLHLNDNGYLVWATALQLSLESE